MSVFLQPAENRQSPKQKRFFQILFRTKSTKSEHFKEWVEGICFTVQMGDSEEKEELAAELIGTDLKQFRRLTKYCHNPMPFIYLISIGKIGEFRDLMDLSISDYPDNDMTIFKYGLSADGHRRIGEHICGLPSISSITTTPKLFRWITIDVLFLKEAETYLGETVLFEYGRKIHYQNQREIVGIKLTNITKQRIGKTFDNLHKKFSGRIEYLEKEHELEIAEKDKEIAKKELEKRDMTIKHNLEIAGKDKEIATLQITLEKEKSAKMMHSMKHNCRKRKRMICYDDDNDSDDDIDDNNNNINKRRRLKK